MMNDKTIQELLSLFNVKTLEDLVILGKKIPYMNRRGESSFFVGGGQI